MGSTFTTKLGNPVQQVDDRRLLIRQQNEISVMPNPKDISSHLFRNPIKFSTLYRNDV